MSHLINGWTIRRLGLIPVFFLSLYTVFSQEVFYDAASRAIGGCYVFSGPGAAMTGNEAALGSISSPSFATEQLLPFVTHEAGLSSIWVRVPVNSGVFQLSFAHLGIPGFRQWSTSAGYGMRLSECVRAGIGFLSSWYSSPGDWEPAWLVGISGGIIYDLLPDLRIGLHLHNPVPVSSASGYGEATPALLSMGLQYRLYENTCWFLETEYHSIRGWRVKTGAECTFTDRVIIRGGFHSTPLSLSLGAGIALERISLFICSQYSVQMGMIPAISLKYAHSR